MFPDTISLHISLCIILTLIHSTSSQRPPLIPPFSPIRDLIYNAAKTPIDAIQNHFRSDLLWCGVRDMAPFPEAVSGVYPNLDYCCRMHDQCPLIVDRGECKLGVCNESFLYPILACSCETSFKKCLTVIMTLELIVSYNFKTMNFL